MWFHGSNKRFWKPFHLFFQVHADVQSFAFEHEFAGLVGDAVSEIQADAFGGGHPDFDVQDIIVAGESLVTQMRFDYGKHEAGFLPLQERCTETAEEFPARCLEDLEIVGVIDVITHRAIGVGHAVRMDETLIAHR